MTDATHRTARTGAPEERVEPAADLVSGWVSKAANPAAHAVYLQAIEQRDEQVRQEARMAADEALEECYRVARHLQDRGTTPKRAAEQIIKIVQIALATPAPGAAEGEAS